jgi:hypothetical protein
MGNRSSSIFRRMFPVDFGGNLQFSRLAFLISERIGLTFLCNIALSRQCLRFRNEIHFIPAQISK